MANRLEHTRLRFVSTFERGSRLGLQAQRRTLNSIGLGNRWAVESSDAMAARASPT